jgi:hypothetical protein
VAGTTCARCGTEMRPDDAFCRSCGASAGAAPVASGGGGPQPWPMAGAVPAPVIEEAVWPDGSPALDPFQPLEGRSAAARILVGGAALMALIAAPLNLHRANAIDTLLTTGDPTDINQSDDWFSLLALPSFVIGVAAIVVFLVWFSRAYKNLPPLGNRRLRFTPGWAVGSWFVPFLNLVRPKAIANDIWKGSDPELPPGPTEEWRDRPVAPLVHWWWGIYLASLFRFTVTFNDVGLDEQDALYARLEAVYNLLTVVAGVLAIGVIGRVTERQRERATRAGAA